MRKIVTYIILLSTLFTYAQCLHDNHRDLLTEEYPHGGRGHQSELLKNPALVKIAEAHNCSVVQVILDSCPQP